LCNTDCKLFFLIKKKKYFLQIPKNLKNIKAQFFFINLFWNINFNKIILDIIITDNISNKIFSEKKIQPFVLLILK